MRISTIHYCTFEYYKRFVLTRFMMTMVTAHQLDQDQDLLTEMRIISSLRPNDRITTNHATKPVVRIQQPTFWRPILRTIANESRNNNISYIQHLFQRLIDRYKAAVKFDDTVLVNRLCTEARSTIDGIRKLQRTYEDDAQFQAAMNVSVDTVCLHLNITPSHRMPVETPTETPAVDFDAINTSYSVNKPDTVGKANSSFRHQLKTISNDKEDETSSEENESESITTIQQSF